MSNNKNLARAKKEKNDEFYTPISAITNEVIHYKKHFKDKVVLCNCNDDETKNFTRYFWLNFEDFGLKRLLCVSFSFENKGAYYIDINKQNFFIPSYDFFAQDFNWFEAQAFKKPLKGNGDFRSQECIDLLKQADIVVTNPPFSLFREYIAQLIKYDKKFLILGNISAVTYKDVFPLIKENKIWLGSGIGSSNIEFMVPDSYDLFGSSCRVDNNGKKIIKFSNVRWFTNLDIEKQHENLILYKKYTPEEYPKYDNYDAININKTVDIPIDYNGVMGVPITFLDKYNPEQFEILDARDYAKYSKQKEKETYLVKDKDGTINSKATYARILVRKKFNEVM